MKASVDPPTAPDSSPPAEVDPKTPQSSAPAPKGGAAADESRQVEAQISPSTRGAAPANAPEVTSKGGLTSDEARRRLTKFGPNAIPDTSVHPLRMAVEKFWAPVPWMLEAAIAIELVLGKYVEAGIIALQRR